MTRTRQETSIGYLPSFPTALLKDWYQHLNLPTSNYPRAVKRGLEEILKRESIKGSRHTRITLTVAIVQEPPSL
jgi:hypothetical protein